MYAGFERIEPGMDIGVELGEARGRGESEGLSTTKKQPYVGTKPYSLKFLVSVQIALHKCLKHLAMIRYSEVRKLMDYDLRSELLGLFEQRGVESKSAFAGAAGQLPLHSPNMDLIKGDSNLACPIIYLLLKLRLGDHLDISARICIIVWATDVTASFLIPELSRTFKRSIFTILSYFSLVFQ